MCLSGTKTTARCSYFIVILIAKMLIQFVNKLRYAKEGAKDMMDRACADLPWQAWLEVDGKDIPIPTVCNLSLHGFYFLSQQTFWFLLLMLPLLLNNVLFVPGF